MNSPVNQILYLQRTIGNQAVQRLIKSGTLQTKLRIGQPGDKYEQEAESVADQVMAMPDPGIQRQPENEEDEETLQPKPLANPITPLVQRQEESPEEEEESVQAKSKPCELHAITQSLESRQQFSSSRFGNTRIPTTSTAHLEKEGDKAAQAFNSGREIRIKYAAPRQTAVLLHETWTEKTIPEDSPVRAIRIAQGCQ